MNRRVFSSLRSALLAGPICLVAILNAGIFGHGIAHGQATPEVVINSEAETCSAEFAQRFLQELGLRLSAELRPAASAMSADPQWSVALSVRDEHACEVRLQEGDESTTFVVRQDAEQLELATIATRMSWMIEGFSAPSATPIPGLEAEEVDGEEEEVSAEGDEFESPVEEEYEPHVVEERESQSQPDETDEQPDEQPGVHALTLGPVLDEPGIGTGSKDLSTDTDSNSHRLLNFSAEAVGGAMWLPTTGAHLMLLRAQTSWQPWSWLRVGLAGRLPLGVAHMETAGMRFEYKPWSLDLTTSFTHRTRRRWSFHAGAGMRRTISQISGIERSQNSQEPESPETPGTPETPESRAPESGTADSFVDTTPDTTPRRIVGEPGSPAQAPLSLWAAVAGAGATFSITRTLALSLDATGAMSLSDRTIQENRRTILDLGRFEADVLLGLELRF